MVKKHLANSSRFGIIAICCGCFHSVAFLEERSVLKTAVDEIEKLI